MRVAGLDPGASGAIAVVEDGLCTDLIDMPVTMVTVGKTAKARISPELLAQVLRDLMPLDVAYVEEVASMPKQGVSSVFTFGQAHGMLLGAVAASGVRLVRIRPQGWQAMVGLKGADDPRAKAVALYPGRVGDLNLVKHAGRADALLIAHVGAMIERTMK